MQPGGVRHWPFESKYLRDFEVVEERRDGLRLFPHTEQLPILAKAITGEFERGLTTRLARTDGRADDWRKLCLWNIASSFCNFLSVARPDHLHVQPFLTPDRVARIALVQQISRTTAGGLQHTFRYYHGTQFLPDVHLLGRRPVFSTHCLDRYAQRVNISNGHAVNFLLAELFATVPVFLEIDGPSTAVAFFAGDSMAALPVEVTAEEVLFLTTLSPHEISHAAPVPDRQPIHFHFDRECTAPAVRNFDHAAMTEQILHHWRAKNPRVDFRRLFEEMQTFSLTRVVQETDDTLRNQGYREGAKLAFLDDVYGPVVLTLGPALVRPNAAPAPPAPDHAAPAPRWPVAPPRGKAPGTVSDDVQRHELGRALMEFMTAMADDALHRKGGRPQQPIATERYRQTVLRAAAQGIELSLTWYTLASWTNNGPERIDFFERALACLHAERAKRSEPLPDEGQGADLNIEAECLFEIGRVHFHEGAPAVARKYLDQALPVARQAAAHAQKTGQTVPQLEAHITELLLKLPADH